VATHRRSQPDDLTRSREEALSRCGRFKATMKRTLAVVIAATGLLAASAAAAQRTDLDWALRTTVRAGDVPNGFEATSAAAATNDAPLLCPGFDPDLSDLHLTAQAMSSLFQNRRDGTSIFSTVDVYRSVRDEREAWRRTARPEELRCIDRALRASVGNLKRLAVTRRLVRTPPALGERAISFRVAATITSGRIHLRTWFDVITLSRGRAEASLMVLTVKHPPSAKLERRLLGRLDARLRAR
jgi:hypothetical protein